MARSWPVLLMSANTEKLPDPIVPIGAAYMATMAAQHAQPVDTFDLCFGDALRPLLDEINATCAAHGIRHWSFVDNLFNMLIRRAREIREELAARNHSDWIGPGESIKTNIQVLRKLRECKIKGQPWRVRR